MVARGGTESGDQPAIGMQGDWADSQRQMHGAPGQGEPLFGCANQASVMTIESWRAHTNQLNPLQKT